MGARTAARNPDPTRQPGDWYRTFPDYMDVTIYGQPVSTVPAARWARGELVRFDTPAFRPARPLYEHDPSNPATWNR